MAWEPRGKGDFLERREREIDELFADTRYTQHTDVIGFKGEVLARRYLNGLTCAPLDGWYCHGCLRHVPRLLYKDEQGQLHSKACACGAPDPDHAPPK